MLQIQKNLTTSFFALLSLPATAMGFALSVQISALSWILSTQYKLDIHDVGLVWAAGPIAGIIGQVIIGVISDKVWFWNGRRRPFILIGGTLAAVMLLALPNIEVITTTMGIESILGIAIAVALTLDLAINVSFNPTRSIIADVTPEGVNRTKGYTWMQTISGSFGVLAYAAGAIWDNYVLIYGGAILVFAFSVLPPFFIKEPRQLSTAKSPEGSASFYWKEALISIRPLWGFLIYAVYAMTARVAGWSTETYLVEYLCLGLTILLVMMAVLASSKGKSREEAGSLIFRKVLAAHSFTWLGVQTMFVYMFAYVQDQLPALSDLQMGRVVSIGFLVLNAVAAILPATVLEPISEKVGRVKTHEWCIGIMALGYAGMLFFGQTPLMIYVMMSVIGVGWAATVSLPFAIMSSSVDQSKLGLYMGLFNLSVVLPQLAASLGIGQAISMASDKSLIFIICAISLSISTLAWSRVREETA